MSDLRKMLEDAREEAIKVLGELATLHRHNHTLKNSLERAERTIDDLRREMLKTKDEVERAINQATKFQAELDTSVSRNRSLGAQVMQLKELLENAERRAVSAEAAMNKIGIEQQPVTVWVKSVDEFNRPLDCSFIYADPEQANLLPGKKFTLAYLVPHAMP